MNETKEYTLECVDGPFKAYKEARYLQSGEPFFLNLQHPATGVTHAYEPAGMMPVSGHLAMKHVATGEAATIPVSEFRIWVGDAPATQWKQSQAAILADYIDMAVRKGVKGVSIELHEPEPIDASEVMRVVGSGPPPTRQTHRFLHQREINALLVGKL